MILLALGGYLTRLADADAFALPCDLDVGVSLAANDDIVLDQLDRVVLAIVAGLVLRGESTELLRVEDLAIRLTTILHVLERIFLGVLAMVRASLRDLVAVLCVVVDMQIADLHDRFVLADIHTAQVDSSTHVRILRSDIKETVLAARRLGDIDRVLVAFLFLIRIVDARLRLVDGQQRLVWLLRLFLVLVSATATISGYFTLGLISIFSVFLVQIGDGPLDRFGEHDRVYLLQINVQSFARFALRRVLNLVFRLLFLAFNPDGLVLALVFALFVLNWVVLVELEQLFDAWALTDG